MIINDAVHRLTLFPYLCPQDAAVAEIARRSLQHYRLRAGTPCMKYSLWVTRIWVLNCYFMRKSSYTWSMRFPSSSRDARDLRPDPVGKEVPSTPHNEGPYQWRTGGGTRCEKWSSLYKGDSTRFLS